MPLPSASDKCSYFHSSSFLSFEISILINRTLIASDLPCTGCQRNLKSMPDPFIIT